MVRKSPIALAEQAARLDAELREKLRRHQCPGSVAAIQNHFEIARELANASGDIVDVTIDYLLLVEFAVSSWKLPGDGKLVEVLDIGAKNRCGAEAQLETVVLGRIVGARDLDSANDVQIVLRPVCERRRYNSDIDDVDAARQKTHDQRRVEFLPRRPIVTTHRERSLHSLLREEGCESAGDRCRYFFGEILAGNSPDVVLTKNRLREFHRI